ncbi:MAG: hypothetical protein WBC33_01595, partial [Conexibacter sp.]
PVALVPLAVGDPGTLTRQLEALVHAVAERVTLATLRLQGALDALPGAKVAAVAASTAALAGGGAAIEHVARPHANASAQAANVTPAATTGGSGALTPGLVTSLRSAAAPRSAVRRGAPDSSEFAFERSRASPTEARTASTPPTARAAVFAAAPRVPLPTARPPAEFAGP